MEIILAENAGFCFGVERALRQTYEEAKTCKVSTYGPLIHNKFVTDDLFNKGVNIVDDLEKFDKEKLIIRSHGVSKKIFKTMEEKNISYTDCTCPYVTKIHKKVNKAYEEGKEIIIIGNKNHPEIIGISGWADDNCIIIDSIDEIEENIFLEEKKYYLVAQTTFNKETFEKIKKILKNKIKNIEIEDTICSATTNRQQSAINLSNKVDYMIVIGDKKSSNTNKLYEICKKNCEKTYLIESIEDLQLNIFKTSDKIGITAGASTPLAIIKEAVKNMNEIENDNKTFEELLNESYVPPLHTGDIVTGKVIQVSNGEVQVSLQYKADGIISRDEISNDPSVVAEDLFKKDDDIEVYVVKVNDGDGNVLLSKKRIENEKNLAVLEEAFNNNEIVNGKIIDIVKGGAIALINDARVFVPSSQISNKYVNDLTPFKGKELLFNIIEFDKSKRRIVAGRKELASKEENAKREEIFKTLEVGDKIKGVVSRTSDFGAFVDIGGIDGLVHISELSWGRVKKVEDVLKIGDEITVSVLKLDKEKGKISLSLKDKESNPWTIAAEKYAIGNIVEGKIVRMVPFGAFVELEPGVDGLIHISQISDKHVAKPEDVLSINEVVTVKVTDIDLENNKISLSIKEAVGTTETVEETVEAVTEEA